MATTPPILNLLENMRARLGMYLEIPSVTVWRLTRGYDHPHLERGESTDTFLEAFRVWIRNRY